MNCTSRTPRAFTLLEVMIATVIMAVTFSALFFTFRTGVMAWRSGHVASETFQSAQQAQDVIVGDLTRCFFITENHYNITFNAQLQAISSYEDSLRSADTMKDEEREGFLAGVQVPQISPQNMAIPVNLRFKGQDGGVLDEIEFARHQSPWTIRADITWGVRRIRYFVKDGILYREEKSPFGLPDGKGIREFMAERFLPAEDSRSTSNAQRTEGVITLTEEDLDRFEGPPPQVEPLCDGVELFNVTFGYFKGGEWVEVKDWDSSAFKYRFPSDELENTTSMGNAGAASPTGPLMETGFTPPSALPGFEQRVAIVGGEAMTFAVEQDDLPSYCAIQIGVREPAANSGDAAESGGRLHSFTFFVTLPKAQEKLDPGALDGASSAGLAVPGT